MKINIKINKVFQLYSIYKVVKKLFNKDKKKEKTVITEKRFRILAASWKLYGWLKKGVVMEELRRMVMRYVRIFMSAAIAGGVGAMITEGQADPIIIPFIPIVAVVFKLFRDLIGKSHPNWAKWLPV